MLPTPIGHRPSARRTWRWSAATWATLAVGLFYGVVAFWVLHPEALYSGDMGVKIVQAHSLARQRFTSLSLAYPGQYVDGKRDFFPFRPPFVFETATGELQSIFPTAPALLYASFSALGGTAAVTLLSVLSVTGLIWLLRDEVRGPLAWMLPVVMGLGTPLWFYAVVPWEHALAVGCTTAALLAAFGVRVRPGISALVSGALLGLGATFRDETLLVLPALLLAVWLVHRRRRDLLLVVAGVSVPVLGIAALDVAVYGRPAGAHLVHAVSLLQGSLTSADLPTRVPLTWRERWDTVIHYWLVADIGNRWFFAALAGLTVGGLLVRWRNRYAVLLGLSVILLAMAVRQLVLLWPAPHWVAGLFRLSPFLLFAFYPLPRGENGSPLRTVCLFASLSVIVLALLTTDTSGGKSLGPRLLLPIVPLLALAAWQTVAACLRQPRRSTPWWVGVCGAALAVVGVTFHLACGLRPYVARNSEDWSAVVAARRSPVDTIVADDQFTAQLLAPVYFDKTLLLAGHPALGRVLSARLAAARIREALLVSRADPIPVSLEPCYWLAASEQAGRMTLQRWVRHAVGDSCPIE